MQQQQQQGLQITLQQHAACCRSFQLQLLLPLVQVVLQRLQFILDNPQPHSSGHDEIGQASPPPAAAAAAPLPAVVAAVIAAAAFVGAAAITAAILSLLDVACSWSFGHLLLRLSSADELSLAPPPEWIPVFFPAAAAAASAASAAEDGGSSAAAAVAAASASAGGLETQQSPQQEGLFVLVLRLYKLLRGVQQQEPELFTTIRYVLQRIAKFRPISMADALLGTREDSNQDTSSSLSPLPLKKSYSGPVGRDKKERLTSLVYVPLMQVLLDLLETCGFTERLPPVAAAAAGSPDKATSINNPTDGATQKQQPHVGSGPPSPAQVQELEEVQDICAALANLADSIEAVPEILFENLAARAAPLFASKCPQLYVGCSGSIRESYEGQQQRYEQQQQQQGLVVLVGLGLLGVAAGDAAESADAAEALALLLRAWSSWVSRLLVAAETRASPPSVSPLQQQQQQQQQQMGLSELPWWHTLRDATTLLVETFIHRGLECCSQRDDEHEGVDQAKRKGGLFVLRGGSQLYEFLKALATMAQANPAKALAAAAAKQQQLQQQLQQARSAAAAAAAASAAGEATAQLRTLKMLQQQQHWLLLHIQLLIVTHHGPEALANHRLLPPKQLLHDEAAQTELLRLLAAVFYLLEVEVGVLKAATAELLQQHQQQQQQQQLLLQVQQQLASPVVLEVGLGVVSLVGKAYLLREKLNRPLLADLLLPEGGLKVLNAGVAVAADCLLALPQHHALSLASARTLQVFADSHNPCSAYLWETAAFQALIDCCCSCCAGLLQPGGAAAAAATATAASSPAIPGDATTTSSSRSSSSIVLRQLSSQSCSTLFAAFAAAAAPSEQLWGLAKRHVEQQQQQQQQQPPLQRSGTMLGNEVATLRTAALLERCSVGLEVLQATAAAAAEGKQPLPIATIRWILSMLGGLASGAGTAGARRLLQWLGPTLRCAFAVTRAAVGCPDVLQDGLKFSRRIAAAGAGCLTQEEAQALLAEYCTVLGAFTATLDRPMSPDEEDAVLRNAKQIFKLLLVYWLFEVVTSFAAYLIFCSQAHACIPWLHFYVLLQQLAGENRGDARTSWMADSLLDCLTALRPLCMALTPTQPKVLGAYLSVVGILLEDDVAHILQRLTPADAHVMMMLAERGALSGQTRLASAALEGFHVLAMHAADVQLQQGHFTTTAIAIVAAAVVCAAAAAEAGLYIYAAAAAIFGAGAATIFDAAAAAASAAILGAAAAAGSTAIFGAAAAASAIFAAAAFSCHSLNAVAGSLATALLQKLPTEQMTAAEQDVLGACLFAALFCIGVRAYALRHLLQCFATNFAAQRLEEMQSVVLTAVKEAVPADVSGSGGEGGGAPPTPRRFKRQALHRREDAFKAELANFVAEFASFGPSTGTRQ
ncbi:hypothetical protein ACSSS7_005596 [Eimeria intestinalis]